MKCTFIEKVQKGFMEVAVRSVGKSVPISMYERKVPEEMLGFIGKECNGSIREFSKR